MKGHFLCYGEHVSADGVVVVPIRYSAQNDPGPPTVADIAESYRPIQMAELVIFVGEDGSAWEIKSRYYRLARSDIPGPILLNPRD